MTSAFKIAELEARRDRLYEEAFEVAGREPFTLSDHRAYRALTEEMEGCVEYLRFLNAGCREVKPQRKTRPATLCIVCGSVAHGTLCLDCFQIWLELEKQQ